MLKKTIEDAVCFHKLNDLNADFYEIIAILDES